MAKKDGNNGFIKNVFGSIKSAGKETAKSLMPNLSSAVSTNKESIKTAYSDTRTKFNEIDIKNNYLFKSGKNLIKNAMSDLKTGNLNNTQRQKENSDDPFAALLNFDIDSIDSGNDDVWGEEVPEPAEPSNDTLNLDFDEDTKNDIKTMANFSMANTNITNRGFAMITTQLKAISQFQNKNTLAFYQMVEDKLNTMENNLNIQSAYYKDMVENSKRSARTENGNPTIADAYEMGTIDLSVYAKMVKKNLDDIKGAGSMVTSMMIKPMITDFVNNPFGSLMKYGMKSLVPKGVQKSMSDIDKTIGMLPILLQGRTKAWQQKGGAMDMIGGLLGKDKNKFKDGLLGMLGSMLDFDKFKIKANKNEFIKGPVPFDGITKRSITHVIPGYLKRILFALSGKEKDNLVYDMDMGKFVTVEDSKKNTKNELDNAARDTFANGGTELLEKEYLKALKEKKIIKKDEDANKYIDDLRENLSKLGKQGKTLASDINISDLATDKKSGKVLMGVLNNLDSSGFAETNQALVDSYLAYTEKLKTMMDSDIWHSTYDRGGYGVKTREKANVMDKMESIGDQVTGAVQGAVNTRRKGMKNKKLKEGTDFLFEEDEQGRNVSLNNLNERLLNTFRGTIEDDTATMKNKKPSAKKKNNKNKKGGSNTGKNVADAALKGAKFMNEGLYQYMTMSDEGPALKVKLVGGSIKFENPFKDFFEEVEDEIDEEEKTSKPYKFKGSKSQNKKKRKKDQKKESNQHKKEKNEEKKEKEIEEYRQQMKAEAIKEDGALNELIKDITGYDIKRRGGLKHAFKDMLNDKLESTTAGRMAKKYGSKYWNKFKDTGTYSKINTAINGEDGKSGVKGKLKESTKGLRDALGGRFNQAKGFGKETGTELFKFISKRSGLSKDKLIALGLGGMTAVGNTAGDLIGGLGKVIGGQMSLKDAGKSLWKGTKNLGKSVFKSGQKGVHGIKNVFKDGGVKGMKDIVKGGFNKWKDANKTPEEKMADKVEKVSESLDKAAESIKGVSATVEDSMIEVTDSLENATTKASDVISNTKDVISDVGNSIEDTGSLMDDVSSSTNQGFIGKLTGKLSDKFTSFKEKGSNILGNIKDFVSAGKEKGLKGVAGSVFGKVKDKLKGKLFGKSEKGKDKEKFKMTKLKKLIGKVKDREKSLSLVAIMNTLPLISKIKKVEEETAEIAANNAESGSDDESSIIDNVKDIFSGEGKLGKLFSKEGKLGKLFSSEGKLGKLFSKGKGLVSSLGSKAKGLFSNGKVAGKLGSLASKIPGAGKIASKVGGLASKIPGAANIASKIPGIAGLASKVPGLASLAGTAGSALGIGGSAATAGAATAGAAAAGSGLLATIGSVALPVAGVGLAAYGGYKLIKGGINKFKEWREKRKKKKEEKKKAKEKKIKELTNNKESSKSKLFESPLSSLMLGPMALLFNPKLKELLKQNGDKIKDGSKWTSKKVDEGTKLVGEKVKDGKDFTADKAKQDYDWISEKDVDGNKLYNEKDDEVAKLDDEKVKERSGLNGNQIREKALSINDKVIGKGESWFDSMGLNGSKIIGGFRNNEEPILKGLNSMPILNPLFTIMKAVPLIGSLFNRKSSSISDNKSKASKGSADGKNMSDLSDPDPEVRTAASMVPFGKWAGSGAFSLVFKMGGLFPLLMKGAKKAAGGGGISKLVEFFKKFWEVQTTPQGTGGTTTDGGMLSGDATALRRIFRVMSIRESGLDTGTDEGWQKAVGVVSKALSDGAGTCYGPFSFTKKNQMNPNESSMNFYNYCKQYYPDIISALSFPAGTAAFDESWKKLGETNRDRLWEAEANFELYCLNEGVKKIQEKCGINLNDGSHVEATFGLLAECYNQGPASGALKSFIEGANAAKGKTGSEFFNSVMDHVIAVVASKVNPAWASQSKSRYQQSKKHYTQDFPEMSTTTWSYSTDASGNPVSNESNESNNTTGSATFNGTFIHPVPSTSKVNDVYNSVAAIRGGRRHIGIDLEAEQGTNVVAAAAGKVTRATKIPKSSGGEMWTYGNFIDIDHGNGYTTRYGHLKDGGFKVKVGQHVNQGQSIALSGATGNVSGAHLHFEIRKNGSTVNPQPYIYKNGKPVRGSGGKGGYSPDTKLVRKHIDEAVAKSKNNIVDLEGVSGGQLSFEVLTDDEIAYMANKLIEKELGDKINLTTNNDNISSTSNNVKSVIIENGNSSLRNRSSSLIKYATTNNNVNTNRTTSGSTNLSNSNTNVNNNRTSTTYSTTNTLVNTIENIKNNTINDIKDLASKVCSNTSRTNEILREIYDSMDDGESTVYDSPLQLTDEMISILNGQ